jgi:ABC-2 type transport system ATP-binding protein
MRGNIIEINGLTKVYESTTVVNQLDLTIKKGEIFGLLGPNGAGKSTTIRMMLGLTEPTSGIVNVCGLSSITNPLEVKRKVGYLPEDVGFYGNMTGLENLMFSARLNQMPEKEAKELAAELLMTVGLSKDASRKTNVYSRGMRQRLGLADTLIKQPEIIILDEPTLGIDPNGVKEFLNLIVELSRKQEITVLFSSHHLYQVQQVCDRVGLFVKGKLIAEGDMQTLSKNLFSSSPFVYEVQLLPKDAPSEKISCNGDFDHLLKVISDLEGVSNVNFSNGTCIIDSEKDISPMIAKTIVEQDCSLYGFYNKEYGLDDIYYKYFEGGENHE